MDQCGSCGDDIIPFAALSKVVQRTVQHTTNQLPSSYLLRQAFTCVHDDEDTYQQQRHKQHQGFASLLTDPNHYIEQDINTDDTLQYYLQPTSSQSYYYRRPKPNCILSAVTSGIRGAVVGSVFGGAMGKFFF